MIRPRRPVRALVVPPLLLIATTVVTVVTLVAPASAASTLASAAAITGRYFGAAVDPAHFGESDYATTLNTQFSAVTPENAMKWDATEPSPGSFQFAAGDQVVSSAQAHGQRVRGHTLVWHSQLPSWVGQLPADQVQSAMENHINGVAGHFRGSIYAWDVVNEPLNEDGTLRSSPFLAAMGVGYIADALRTARAADPNAKLYLNDYNIEGLNAKSDAMFALAQSLRAQGVPLDGIGFESHFILNSLPSSMQTNLARFAGLGLDVAITELDIRMRTPFSSRKLSQQATNYQTVVNACLAVTRCVGMTTWGVTDKYSWVPGFFRGYGAALLFDDNYQAKPAEVATVQALGG
jgi:endo-1,4-beta-xylanase